MLRFKFLGSMLNLIDTNKGLCRYTVIIVLVVVVAISCLTWVFAPKENTTVFRSSVILGLAMCYLMWAITYLAQLHPLEAPRRSDLRPEFAE